MRYQDCKGVCESMSDLSSWLPTTTSFSSTMLECLSLSSRLISLRLLMGIPVRRKRTRQQHVDQLCNYMHVIIRNHCCLLRYSSILSIDLNLSRRKCKVFKCPSDSMSNEKKERKRNARYFEIMNQQLLPSFSLSIRTFFRATISSDLVSLARSTETTPHYILRHNQIKFYHPYL